MDWPFGQLNGYLVRTGAIESEVLQIKNECPSPPCDILFDRAFNVN